MAGHSKPVRASGISSSARTEERERNGGNHPLAPFWAFVGASLPWLVYDALIKIPEDFWTFRGVLVLAATALGVILVGVSWHYSRGLSERDKSL
ncbi:MAG TPA: hypothetical protein VFG28_08780 [Syntrophales bacterium]|nr:hypothetical protein [Syntrophales bacterium]